MRLRSAAARLAAVALVPWALAAACNAYRSSGDEPADANDAGARDGAPSGDDASDGAAVPDAPPAGDAADAGEAPLYIEGFETGTVACGDWAPAAASAVRTSSAAHGGSWSCRLCAGTASNGYVAKSVPASAAGTYAMTLWARSDADASMAFVAMATAAADGGSLTQIGTNTVSLPPNGTFTLVEAVAAAEGGFTAITLSLWTAPSTCIDFDDVELDVAR